MIRGKNEKTNEKESILDNLWKIREGIAEDTESVKILEELSKNEDFRVRGAVAENPSTSAEILEMLSNDNHSWVRYNIASNINTNAKLIVRLSNDESNGVRWVVVENSNTDVGILEKLSNDDVWRVSHKANETLNETIEWNLLKTFKNKRERRLLMVIFHINNI